MRGGNDAGGWCEFPNAREVGVPPLWPRHGELFKGTAWAFYGNLALPRFRAKQTGRPAIRKPTASQAHV